MSMLLSEPDVIDPSTKDNRKVCQGKFSLLHLNTRSLLPKIDEIRQLALNLQIGGSVLTLSENWHGSGVLAFVPIFMKAVRRHDLESDSVEIL